MALIKAFCPNCGQPTQIDDTKAFCFCLSCGGKINAPKREQSVVEVNEGARENELKQHMKNMIEEENEEAQNISVSVSELEEKMKEAEFYYRISVEKKEYADVNGDPKYYLRGQDLLIDLSQQYPSDYRVWWELSKPMDFAVVLSGEKSMNPGLINNSYFDKALDLAPLDQKMELIQLNDKYMELKSSTLKEIEAMKKEREVEKHRLEELQKKEERERQEREKKETVQNIEIQQKMCENAWADLKAKNYTRVDSSYFRFDNAEGVPIIATFKVVANVLYLLAYHLDNKNTVYLDQSIAIQFRTDGVAARFDNRPVVVKGWSPGTNNIKIMVYQDGSCKINGFDLIQDVDYVAGVSKSAKKPFKKFKIFI